MVSCALRTWVTSLSECISSQKVLDAIPAAAASQIQVCFDAHGNTAVDVMQAEKGTPQSIWGLSTTPNGTGFLLFVPDVMQHLDAYGLAVCTRGLHPL